jgi:hypothetical protein
MLKRPILAVLVVVAIVCNASAADVTIPFTAGQNTYVRNTTIPQANADRCRQYNLPTSPMCTTANVVAAGCVATNFADVTLDNLVYRSCTIYTSDAAGETAFKSDELYTLLVARTANDLAKDVTDTCAAFKAANTTARNNACAAIGRPSGCRIC